MNLLSSFLSGKYIDIVKKYIDKIFKHEAELHNHQDDEFDIILRKVNGSMRIYIYSRRDNKLLRELQDTEAEEILTD